MNLLLQVLSRNRGLLEIFILNLVYRDNKTGKLLIQLI